MAHRTFYELLPRDLTRERRCSQCGAWYKEADEIGYWACRVHPGVRLVDETRPFGFYSCCDAQSDAQGCVACDHSDAVLSRSEILIRLAQLQQFAVHTYPQLLRRYLRPPRRETVVYTLPERWNGAGTIAVDFPVLQRALERHNACVARGAHILYDMDPPGAPVEWNARVTLQVEAVLTLLQEQAAQSELFQREMSQEDERTSEIERLCAGSWKNLSQPPKSKLACVIRFAVVARLDRR